MRTNGKCNNGSLFLRIIANSADPDEMPPYAAFHLDLHCLPKYLFTGIENENCLFVYFDYLHPSQQFFSYIGMGLPGLNQ